jgi:hypothetical protein
MDRLRAAIVLVAVVSAACSTTADLVRARAAFDLSCTEAKVTVQEMPGTYVARGCGKEAPYVAASNGNPVLNGPVRDSK